MADSPVLLAKPWSGEDPAGWWMSEKLDGVRAVWDGERFTSRNGNIFYAPYSFRQAMPSIPLDGELYIGRGRFEDTVSIVRAHDAGDRWNAIRFHAFDLYPTTETVAALSFEARIDALWCSHLTAAWKPVTHVRCLDVDHLTRCVDVIVEGGGEGIMLRAPGSRYERKRSSTLLKVKRFLDCEAVVTGHVPGKGKHEGRLGALDCIAKGGAFFQVGTGFSDAQRAAPPAVGSTITVRYQELTKAGVPRFPVFVSERNYE